MTISHEQVGEPRGTEEWLHGQAVLDPFRWLEDGEGELTRRWTAEQTRRYDLASNTWARRDEFRRRLTDMVDFAGFGRRRCDRVVLLPTSRGGGTACRTRGPRPG